MMAGLVTGGFVSGNWHLAAASAADTTATAQTIVAPFAVCRSLEPLSGR
jgi:hypothetical protein